MKILLLLIVLLSGISFPQFITPGTAVVWNMDSLVARSGGTVTGAFPNYQINNLVTVSAGDRVIIGPGTIVTFTSTSAGFEINGMFTALGGPENRIIFTASSQDSLGAYQGFRFNDTSVDSLCKIQFADINFAYYGMRAVDASPTYEYVYLFKCRRGIQLSGSNATIRHSKIQRSYEYGITMTLGSSPLIEWNIISDNNTQNTSPKNQISIGTQGNNSPTIRYNKISNSVYWRTGGISISALFSGSSSSAVIAYNEIFNNSFGIALAGGDITAKIHHNKIYNNNINPDPNTSGSGINCNGTSVNKPVISHNEIFGNHWGITIQNSTTIQEGPAPNIGDVTNADTTDDGYNKIYNNGNNAQVFDLFNNCTNDVKAQNNDWGVYDSLSIEGHIVHKADSSLRGTVIFMPFRNPVVPVELSSFTAVGTESGVLLKWATASEKNNRGFTLLRSKKDSENYEFVAFISGAGSSITRNEYEFTDSPGSGTFIYRLIQEDFDGTKTIVSELEVTTEQKPVAFHLEQNYPNPFNPSTNIVFTIPESGFVSLEIYDALGAKVQDIFSGFLSAGKHIYMFNANSLSGGVYFCRLQSGANSFVRQMLLIK